MSRAPGFWKRACIMVQEANNIKKYSEFYTLGLSYAKELIIFMKRVNFEDEHCA
jgi:hypothetical protein